MTTRRATAVARTNIALVKYWGKRDAALNLPAVGSLSLTLDGLETRTTVAFDENLGADELVLGGVAQAGVPLGRVSRLLDLVRARAGLVRARAGLVRARAATSMRARVVSANNFPTAAGLASSASAFAALAVASSRAAGLDLDGRELSILARRGSGSAARSIFGGLVLMHRGERADGSDAFAEPLGAWDLRLVVGVIGEGPKSVLSTDGMSRTAETSPYYAPWVATHPADLDAASEAVARRDLEALGEITERSCLKMHASALAARPGVLYWSGATVDAFHAVRALRARGVPAWFTNDAGPHVKALCPPEAAGEVARALGAVAGVTRTITCAPGAAATIVEDVEADKAKESA